MSLSILSHWRDFVEISILWIIVYNTYCYFKNTRSARIFTALLGAYLCISLITNWLNLDVIGWILKNISVLLVISIIIIFQPELRRIFAELGSNKFFYFMNSPVKKSLIEKIVESVINLSNKREGALIALQRNITLKQYYETGVLLESKVSSELISTIFHKGTELHDGGMIVRVLDEKISGASFIFPLIQKEIKNPKIGLRHRAAMGITEESDAIAIVVSEENGNISVSYGGDIKQNLSKKELIVFLTDILIYE